jgi:D-arabinose 1-dehydrogenase-like Zn-dependent alcohol dehydrogenase
MIAPSYTYLQVLTRPTFTASVSLSCSNLPPQSTCSLGADAEPISVSLIDLISKRIRIIGSQQNGPEYLYEGLDFVAQGKVKTIVETYPLAEAPKAYNRVAQARLDSALS